MALILPKGIVYGVAPITDTTTTVTGVTSASPAIATGTTAAPGTVVVLRSARWGGLNNRATVVGDNSQLLGVDTRDTGNFSGTSGVVTLAEAGEFVDFSQEAGMTTNGGEQQYWTGSFKEDRSGRQISVPTEKTPTTTELRLYFDPDAGYYDQVKALSDRGEPVVLRMRLPNGDAFYAVSYLSFNDALQISDNAPIEVRATFSYLSETTLVRA